KTEVQQNEIAWILAGKNPETEFAKAYYRSPKVKQSDWAYALKHKSNKEWHRKIRQHRAVEIERIDWKPPKTEISIDPKVVSYLDQRVVDGDQSNLQATKTTQTRPASSTWYWWLIALVVIAGGLYAYVSQKS
ncbi:MAG: hypothetical protein AAFP02_06135, partial [Bacteroidota bacterium]